MYKITDLSYDMIREIIKWLYYENKFDISAVGRLAMTCRYFNLQIDLNGPQSPITTRDRARRKLVGLQWD